MVSEMGAVSQQRAPGPELSPNIESTRTESDQEELEDHDATAYVSFHSSERIHARQASEAIAQIEHLTLNILEQIVASLEKPPVVGKHSKSNAKVEIQIADRRRDKTSGRASRVLRFPAQTKSPSSRPIAQLLRVMNFAHEALIQDLSVTKRDLFYKDVALFRSQKTVDKLVDDLAATLELNRADLNIRATSKGLVCGSGLIIHLLDGQVLRVNDSEGTLIPAGEDIERFEVDSDMSWVLVIEKEAVFQTLCRLRFTRYPGLPGRGLIVTGKGYPDIATRQLVKTLSDNLPDDVPIVGLVDGDAYGLDILSVYRYGSQSLRHENEKLAAHRIQWLGIRSSDLAGLGIHLGALIPITKHDEKKALAMLQHHGNTLPGEWRKELMRILHTRRKAEIEILTSGWSGNQVEEEPRGTSCLVHYICHRILHFVEMAA
ncbi:DNA topoisomerase IV alpha subunit [Boletus coccyginus]|nr:DNA topoisomerase IV alpha subunit [Boletus coccyginus]